MRREVFERLWRGEQVEGVPAETAKAVMARKAFYDLLAMMGRLQRQHPDPRHFYQLFRDAGDEGGGSEVIHRMACQLGVPACVMARMVLKGACAHHALPASHVGQWLKSPDDLRLDLSSPEEVALLRDNIKHCLMVDAEHSPAADGQRAELGNACEERIRRWLQLHDIPFLEERQCRQQGAPKTPDFRLLFPIIVTYGKSPEEPSSSASSSFVICWIESKAMFGDPRTDAQYHDEQFVPYWTRFGPGLVLYWFDFVEDDDDDGEEQGKRIHRAARLPDAVERMRVLP